MCATHSITTNVDSVFGCELQKLCERENTNVPRFLVKFMEHIEERGLEVVGIYRLSGNAASVTKLRYLVEQGKTPSTITPLLAFLYFNLYFVLLLFV